MKSDNRDIDNRHMFKGETDFVNNNKVLIQDISSLQL